MNARRFVAGALLAACQDVPRAPPHVQLYFTTNAPVPGTLGAHALFDTLRVEVDAPSCAGCTRQFELQESMLETGASMTIESPSGARVHAVLFRSDASPEQAPGATVETWVAVPDAPAEGELVSHVFLDVEAVGRARGSKESPLPALLGPPPTRSVWPGAMPKPCSAQVPPARACVPGGAFWFGDLEADPGIGMTTPVLTVVSPFLIDAHEMTVAEFRSVWDGDRVDLGVFSGEVRGTRVEDFCTFTPEPGVFEELPINCLSWSAARRACIARGGDLPTEAQYEYAARRQGISDYPWGFDPPRCEDAVVAREPDLHPFDTVVSGRCRGELSAFVQPAQRVDHGRDEVRYGDRPVFDLAGNLSEWQRDRFQRSDGPCWSEPGAKRDPYCSEGPLVAGVTRTVRGGHWLGLASYTRAIARFPAQPSLRNGSWVHIGFRCVYPAPDAPTGSAIP